MTKVCHISSAHNSHDIRIFIKECRSLAKAGYEVLFVAYGESELIDGVQIMGLGERPESRKARMVRGAREAFEMARGLEAEVYHLHDPELLPYVRKLKKTGAKVIFDSHEDVPSQIMSKDWIPRCLRSTVSAIYRAYETRCVKRLDAVVAATPHIAKQFKGRATRVVVVNNYPLLSDITFQTKPFSQREPIACYTGGISESRGEKVMVEAMKGVDGKLVLAGRRNDKSENGGGYDYLGVLDRSGVNALYADAVVGLVLLQPLENYRTSRPIKMYEYMAAGLPVVASNFPEWRSIIEENGCGLCVPADDPEAVGRAISIFIDDRNYAQEVGIRGRRAIEEKYNWAKECECLCELYETLAEPT